MIRIKVLVEGQTEEAFVNELLVEPYANRGIYLTPIIVLTSPGHRGGLVNYAKVRRQLEKLCREDQRAYVTTLFDLYALPVDFPGKSSPGYPLTAHGQQKAAFIERALEQIVPAWFLADHALLTLDDEPGLATPPGLRYPVAMPLPHETIRSALAAQPLFEDKTWQLSPEAWPLDAAQLAAGIDTMPEGIAAAGGDLAKFALQQKLVTALKTREEFEDLMIERGVADDDADGGFRNVDFGTYLGQLDARRNPVDNRPQVAVVVAAGEISGGDLPAGRIGGESTSALLRAARDDENVKAVVLRVDSPGGEVFASEQIRREVVALQAAGKPVVVSMGDLAASGGYWISMNADRIYADPSTITGSIGIFGMVPNFSRALDKIGVHTDGVGTTRFAGAFDVTRPMDPAVGQVIQSVINKGYADFTGRVADARKKPVEAVDEVARGRVWSGAQAKERGLVDAFGGLKDAVADAASRAKLGKADAYRVRYIEKAATPFAQFVSGFAGSRAGAWMLSDSGMARMVLARTMPEVDTQLRFVENAAREKGNGTPVKALAYCFCGF